MKAISLLLLRISTGIYLVFWGGRKIFDVQGSIGLSDRYYGGMLSSEMVNLGLGAIQVVVGALVVLGLFRAFIYKAQAVCYGLGLLIIIKYILDPFGLYLVEAGRLTWFPSTTLFIASLIMIAFIEYDTKTLDSKRGN